MSFFNSGLTIKCVKERLDELPEGVCFYDEVGNPYVYNNLMDEIAISLTGHSITNAKKFVEQIRKGIIVAPEIILIKNDDIIVLSNGEDVFSFKETKVSEKGFSFRELRVVDVTEEYNSIHELKVKKAALEKQQRQLKKIGDTITQMTIEKEILAAKVRVHDKLGETLIVAKRYLITGDGDPLTINKLWRDNLRLLKQIDRDPLSQEREDPLKPILKAAQDIGVEVEFEGDLPTDTEVLRLLSRAVHDCVTNAIKHANATVVNVKIECDGRRIEITNNGNPPSREIKENGGLKNLRLSASAISFDMIVESSPKFKLVLVDKNLSRE